MRTAEDIINKIKGKALLAPMLATTDIPFRRICREFGAAMTCTEMVSAAGILHSVSRSFRNAVFGPDEHPIAVQLVVAQPEEGAAAATELQRLHPDMFDINCGCPNERICDAGAGAELLDDLSRFSAIIESVATATSIPVTVKVRQRGRTMRQSVRDIVRAAEDHGASMITIHARARSTPYRVAADWDVIADAVAFAHIPVIGNGDVFSSADASRMLDQTGCHAVMVARGSLGTPWIFRDIAEQRNCSIESSAPTIEELQALVHRHLAMIADEFGPVRAIPRMRKHALWYARHYEGTDALRQRIFVTEEPDALIGDIDAFFSAHPPRLDREDDEAKRIERAFHERVLYWTTDVAQTEG